MLLPVVPQMFVDTHFNCRTTLRIREEFRTTTKFKDRYPWRKYLAGNIKTIPAFHKMNIEATRYERTIDNLVEQGVINKRTDSFFDLSKEDMELLAWALALETQIISGDKAINDFGNQEFGYIFKGIIFPLKALNYWLEQGLIEWNEKHQACLEDWNRNEERPQPKNQKTRFEKLTGYPYVGS